MSVQEHTDFQNDSVRDHRPENDTNEVPYEMVNSKNNQYSMYTNPSHTNTDTSPSDGTRNGVPCEASPTLYDKDPSV